MTGVKEDFLKSEEKREELLQLIDQLLEEKANQEQMDAWYESFVSMYHAEMHKFYRVLEDPPCSRKTYYIARKEWWTDELGVLAKKTLEAEKTYLKRQKGKLKCSAEKTN